MGLFGIKTQPTILKILSPYAPIRTHTPAIRTAKAFLDMIGDYPMLRRLAQLQIAAENEQFEVGNSPQPSWISKQTWDLMIVG